MPLKAVFFDIDGTLVDSNELHVMAWDEAFRDYGHPVARDKIRVQIGKGADQLIPSLLSGLSPTIQDSIAKRHGELFGARYLKQVRPFPNATDLVEVLHAKGKQVIVTSSAAKAEVDHYVELLKIAAVLNGIVTKDDVANSKPAGDIFAAALAKIFPMAASEAFAIGDTPYDVESALRSDVKTIAVRSGGFSGEFPSKIGWPGRWHLPVPDPEFCDCANAQVRAFRPSRTP